MSWLFLILSKIYKFVIKIFKTHKIMSDQTPQNDQAGQTPVDGESVKTITYSEKLAQLITESNKIEASQTAIQNAKLRIVAATEVIKTAESTISTEKATITADEATVTAEQANIDASYAKITQIVTG